MLTLSDNTISQIRKLILEKEGFIISTDTLNTEDLLGSVFDFFCDITVTDRSELTKICDEIAEYFTVIPTAHNRYYSLTELKDIKIANYFLNEDIFDFMQDICPEDYYFGFSEGDGSCLGFFEYSDEY